MPEQTDIVTGSLNWSGGVDSRKTTTVESANNVNGLALNQLAWLDNGNLRDGGISPRDGWEFRGRVADGSSLYQSGYMYEPRDGSSPYLVLSIGGLLVKVDVDFAAAPLNLSTAAANINPATVEQGYMQQGEEFLIVQAGDGVTLPLFWDGATLRRSVGIIGVNNTPTGGVMPYNEIPAATAMDYYMGRLWYAQGRVYSAGDIVGGTAGSAPYGFRDAILKVTENPLALGGDGFTVPSNAGNIRALKHNANLDTALGQGTLFIFTRKAVYSLNVPVTRLDWIGANTDNQPLQTVVQLVNGAVNDRSIVAISGDLFYQSLEPAIRSLISAIRYFTQWGNIQISANEDRILQFNDRALMHLASGMTFDNRLLQGVLQKQTHCGVVSQAIVPLDFVPISSFGATTTPIWEGMYEGLDILQMFTGNFGGLERAFALVVSKVDGGIDLWEFTKGTRSDQNRTGENRITFIAETPAYTWGQEFLLKKLTSCEIWVDRLFGEVMFTLEWRVDSDPCWRLWHKWQKCSARSCAEDVHNPCGYPVTGYGEGYESTMSLPMPPNQCASATKRPANLGYQFQLRLTVKGATRIRGILLHAQPVERRLYDRMVC